MKNSYLTVTDQFCGAGGSSQGVRMAAAEMKIGNGIQVKLAMNHWKLAIETHNTNFPDTDHVCTDISACDPRRYPSTDILITSPECTVHSPAGGGQAKDALPTQLGSSHDHVMTPPLVIDGGWHESKRIDNAIKDPLSTQDTGQTKGLVLPYLIELNRTGKARPAKDAMSTVTAGGVKHGLLTPLMVENKGQSKSKPSLEPSASQTTKQSNGIITADQFNSFLTYYNGGSKMASHITKETGTFATGDRVAMVNQPYTKPRLEDCFYRMLLPHEIQLGMAFAPDYIVLGDSKQKVKQLGNAVTPPVMKWIIQRCIESLS